MAQCPGIKKSSAYIQAVIKLCLIGLVDCLHTFTFKAELNLRFLVLLKVVAPQI